MGSLSNSNQNADFSRKFKDQLQNCGIINNRPIFAPKVSKEAYWMGLWYNKIFDNFSVMLYFEGDL